MIKEKPTINRWQFMMLLCLLMLTTLIYWPGLDSRFLLDDFSNLRDLDTIKTYGFPYFIFATDIAGPSGRPLSLVTFALQHESWPSAPFDFKLVNLGIHLLNGCLIYIISAYLTILFKEGTFRKYIPIIVTGLWLLHPIQLTTTLYVIQRMTLLSTFFMLLGVLTYLLMRLKHADRQSLYKDCLTGGLILFFTALAILCKENGILLLIYILSLEITILMHLQRPKYWSHWTMFFLISPLTLLIIYLAFKFEANLYGYAFKDYGVIEKILTEVVVLAEYIKNILLPSPSSFSLYHDNYEIVRSIYSSRFMLSGIILLTLLTTALIKRKSQPIYSFAILWFLGGHLLESTYLNLEPYFEHRNYLPSFSLILGISCGFIYLSTIVKHRLWIILTAFMYCGLILAITVIEVDLWSKPALQINEWARNQPDSIRAKTDLYNLKINKDHEQARLIIEDLKKLSPKSFYPYAEQIKLDNCIRGLRSVDEDWNEFYNIADVSIPTGFNVVVVLDNLTLQVLKNKCPIIDVEKLKNLINHLINNHKYDNVNHAQFYDYLSGLEIFSGNFIKALEYLRLSDNLYPSIEKKIREIKILSSLGKASEAEIRKNELLYSFEQQGNSWVYNKLIEQISMIEQRPIQENE